MRGFDWNKFWNILKGKFMEVTSELNYRLKSGLIFCCILICSTAKAEEIKIWKHSDKLDEKTSAKLKSTEQFLSQHYQIPRQSNPGDANRWMQEVESRNRELAPKAAACLGRFRIKESREILEAAVTNEKGDNRTKWIATRSLSLICDKRCVPVLIGLLDHNNSEVRLYARVALTELAGVYLGENKEKWLAWQKDPNSINRDTGKETGIEANRTPVEKLHWLIDEKYSYRNLRNVNWNGAFAAFAPLMKRANTPEKFAELASKLLERARDPHVRVKTGDKTIGGFKRRVFRNYNTDTLHRIVPGFTNRNNRISTGKFKNGIGYIMISNWSKGNKESLEPEAFDALKEFADAPGLIIDVRPNSGGSEPFTEEFAGCFIDKPVVYSKHQYRTPGEPNGFSQSQERILKPNRDKFHYKGRVAVLMGQVNMSSCESFLLMMKQSPNCKLIGQKSYGSSGNPKPYELGNGVTVWLPSWKNLLPDGTCLEGRGVFPDIVVSTTERQLKNSDPVIDAAIKYLLMK
jgi:hypothetical protein